ncbi:MAG: hypothetical protein HY319_25025 [Armatimonadetes bacterium]|nr:hypothetical protein [Armatimonadota bacterium]
MPRDKDGLTGLYTEEFLKQDMDSEMSRARRFGRDLGLLLLEPILPEHVKTDMLYQVLKKLARICESTTRQVDSGIRWGQQLLYVLPETSIEGVEVTSRKISHQFHECSFTHQGTGEKIPGRLRRALAVFPGEIEEKEELLQSLRDNLKEVALETANE